jgi:hypothetical protein
LPQRPDLAGLSFTLGDACRMNKQQLVDFRLGLDLLRAALAKATVGSEGHLEPQPDAVLFWNSYHEQWALHFKKTSAKHAFHEDTINPAHISGLVQVLMPESAAMRQGLAKYLSGIPHAEATRALARLAIFSPEKQVRHEAIKALKIRHKNDYTDILLAGLKYPWAPVAQRAGEALSRLECADLVPQLVAMLDDPDPRLPVAKTSGGQQTFVVKQLVRLNHHRNCLMCHSPVDKTTPEQAVTAPMPVPGLPLSTLTIEYYRNSDHDILVRADVTYLRQDFAVRQPMSIQEAGPWPRLQRFDFLVRTLKLTPAQAKLYSGKLQPKVGATSPYQQTLLSALRDLTGRDAAPNAAAWRKGLNLPS